MNMSHGARLASALFAALTLSIASQAVAAAPEPSAAERAQIAPGGKLRVGLLVTNRNFVTAGGMTGELQGVAVDLGKALAEAVGAAFEPVRYDSVAKLIDGTGRDWDVTFLSIEPARAAVIDFTGPYLLSQNTYLVPAGSALMTVKDVDRPGVRIGVTVRGAQESFLKADVKRARLVSTANSETNFQALAANQVDAMASSRTILEGIAARMPGYRVLPDNYRATPIALGVPKGRPEALAYANAFLRSVKDSGALQQSMTRFQQVGVTIAP